MKIIELINIIKEESKNLKHGINSEVKFFDISDYMESLQELEIQLGDVCSDGDGLRIYVHKFICDDDEGFLEGMI